MNTHKGRYLCFSSDIIVFIILFRCQYRMCCLHGAQQHQRSVDNVIIYCQYIAVLVAFIKIFSTSVDGIVQSYSRKDECNILSLYTLFLLFISLLPKST